MRGAVWCGVLCGVLRCRQYVRWNPQTPEDPDEEGTGEWMLRVLQPLTDILRDFPKMPFVPFWDGEVRRSTQPTASRLPADCQSNTYTTTEQLTTRLFACYCCAVLCCAVVRC